MVASEQIVAGMILSMGDNKLYRVESSVKVSVPKGQPFIKTKLRSLANDKVMEKNFKLGQEVKEVVLEERQLEFLYVEGEEYLFLDIGNLDKVFVNSDIIGDKVNFLKEGIQLQATFYGSTIFSVELPQFLELMISKTEPVQEGVPMTNTMKSAVLETGAEMKVPRFIEVGDVIKVDTRSNEYVQRV